MISTVNNLANILENQENLRNRLTSDVAHELRTPLTIVRTHLEAMIDGVWEITNERLISCNNELKRITLIVEDLEKIAEIENIILNKTKFNINDLIIDITNTFETELMNKQIVLKKDLKASNIVADKDKIGQVIINLISNAIKYSKNNSIINIRTLEENNKTIIEISDNGIGISEDDLPYIFDRFYRVDKSRNRSTGGSGIGLSIAKTILDAHNSEIIVKSEFGVGSDFIIKI
ncbi:Signal transduction histidine-protein kinase BaeS [compost metagenome]